MGRFGDRGGGGEAARTAGINRIVGGNPPTMMQFNTGKQLDELVNNGYLANLDAAAAAGDWKDILPKPIVNASMRDGHWYALPINIHGANWVFYNTKVFADAGVPEPKTWSDLVAAGPKAEGQGRHPLRPRRAGVAGPSAVRRGSRGRRRLRPLSRRLRQGPETAIASPAFKRVAETFKQLGGLMDPGMPGRNWNDATAMVITGKAGFQVMGDWAKGEFLSARPDRRARNTAARSSAPTAAM